MRLPKTYTPSDYEDNIYALWDKSGVFQTKNRGNGSRYSLTLPPPNANGDLHMGHALTVALEDSLVRYHRLQGKAALYIPGADHAGFETQVVYEKKLAEKGRSRFDYSREELYKLIWEFVEQNKHNFENQLRALGASVDWTRFTFTLDNKVVATAYDTFKKMWDEGLIYRGKRIVNFCSFHGTSFSDIEITHEEEQTKLWHIAYPLADGGGEVVIATTRPETKLGQAALMVNPEDPRYKDLVGKEVNQPLVPDTPIKIIADDYVDKDFGTGVVTVTPAHDPNDFEVAQRNKLPVAELITPEGKMSGNVPKQFRGMSVEEARTAVEKELKQKGYLRKVEDYRHSVAKCYKCGTTIEPLLREQWFVKMRPLADTAIDHLKKNEIKFYPRSKLNQTIRYLEEVKDWNISRQIAWGIPIPAYQNTDDPSDWVFDTRIHEEIIELKGKTYRRDPDVFDTWFSSGQWPYVTLDFPDSDDFKKFYPLDLMETGGEILYQWVARMVMLGLYKTGKVPFSNVYIHGYVLAEDGQKMSKSLGNVVNPLDLIQKYGSDALRMGLLTGRRAGVNQGYHPAKIVAGRNFANKIWNIARFIEDKVGEDYGGKHDPKPESRADHWILSRLNTASKEISKAMENYRLSEAYEALYDFVWRDLADWYIEAGKSSPNAGMMAYLLESTLKLAHPFAPFLTETIWQTLKWEDGTMLAEQIWPQQKAYNSLLAAEFKSLATLITEARQAVKNLGVSRPKLYFKDAPLIKEEAEFIKRMVGLGEVSEATDSTPRGLKLTEAGFEAGLDIDAKTAAAYFDKLKGRRDERRKAVKLLEERLGNADYTSKAPKELVAQSRAKLEKEKQLFAAQEAELQKFESSIS